MDWRDDVLFVIDASPPMLNIHPQDPLKRSYFDMALAVVIQVLERKLTRIHDKVGVLLYGTVGFPFII